jgi:hypothetical protein
MPTQIPATVKVATRVSLTQRIALLFVVTVGVIVVGSVAFAAILTWTSKDSAPVQTALSDKATQTPSVLGVETDFTFEIDGPAAPVEN